MVVDEKAIGDLTEADIRRLVDEKVKELRVVDYKSQLPGGSNSEKKEFLANVSSFANARGGYLLYGVDEAGGESTAVCGVESADPDAEILHLENMVLSGIAPRLQVHTAPVRLENARFVLHDLCEVTLLVHIRYHYSRVQTVQREDQCTTQ